MDWKNNAIVYSQQFPEKSLDGHYIFDSKILGQPLRNAGNWSLVLYDYSQTTTVKRIGGAGGRLKVRVEIDKIGDMRYVILFHSYYVLILGCISRGCGRMLVD